MSPRYLPAISSMSLGRAWNHAIEPKLEACGKYGFKAIELFYEDLEYVARSLPASHPAAAAGTSFSDSTLWQEKQLAAADYIYLLCVQNGLDILCLQPFMHAEGLTDESQHEKRVRKLELWFHLAHRLHTDLIQIPSNFLPRSQCTGDRRKVVADLQQYSDLGLQQSPTPIRFAFEALCWGTHIDLWNEAWEVVKAVDRLNFGTCLDTFNIAGRVWADPAQASGKTANADADMQKSLELLRREIDITKVFYVEVVDAERLDQPLTPEHEWHVEGQKPRMSWSRNARLFPFEAKGYLPVLSILETICDLGYTGYVSFELFSRSMNEAHAAVPVEHAVRGQASWAKLVHHMGWDDVVVLEQQEGKTKEEASRRYTEEEGSTKTKTTMTTAKKESRADAHEIQLSLAKL